MSSDWYARKFGRTTAPRETQPMVPAYEPQTAPRLPTFGARPGQRPPQHAGEAALQAGDFAQAAMYWQGGEATRTETQHCPECGSPNFFSRQNRATTGGRNLGGGATGRLVTTSGTMSVAPQCFDCNYNGLYDLRAG